MDLATTDTAAAKHFYGELFGWEPEEMPAGEAGTYTMPRLRGLDVAALFEQREEERSRGVPPHWNSYVRWPTSRPVPRGPACSVARWLSHRLRF